MSALTPFRYAGQDVRTITIDGVAMFVAKDVATVLGYAHTPSAIIQHCKGVAIHHTLATAGGAQSVRVIAESDVLRMIIGSRLPEAEQFERWVFEDVLPTIRKTGSYGQPAPVVELTRLQILEMAMESEQRAIAQTERADAAEATITAIHGNDGLAIRNFVKKYFPDVKETDIFATLYAKHLLISDPRGRWSDKQQKRIPGPTHMHPYSGGKQFFELREEFDRDKNMHLKTRVRRDGELALVDYLESQGFTSNRLASLTAVNS